MCSILTHPPIFMTGTQIEFTMTTSSWRLDFAGLWKSNYFSCDNIVLLYMQQNNPYLNKKIYKYHRIFLSFDSRLFLFL